MEIFPVECGPGPRSPRAEAQPPGAHPGPDICVKAERGAAPRALNASEVE